MGIRETFNRHSKATAGVLIGVLAIGAAAIATEMKGNNGLPPAKNYFSADDGQTWFADSSLKLPPFDHEGAQAYRCYVFEAKSGRFAGLLEKYDDDTKAKLAQRTDKLPPRDTPVLVKKPGEKAWTRVGPDQEASILIRINAPDGSDAQPILP